MEEGAGMRVEAHDGTVVLRLGEELADLERIVEVLESFAPYSELIVDFTDAYEFPDASFPSLCQAIRRTDRPHLAFRGLTVHQSRLLRYLGLLR
jgi:hypothetical protein